MRKILIALVLIGLLGISRGDCAVLIGFGAPSGPKVPSYLWTYGTMQTVLPVTDAVNKPQQGNPYQYLIKE